MIDQRTMEDSILDQFKNDLRDMTKTQMQKELDRVQDQIDELEPWAEALSIAIARKSESQ
jgi:hypothetical protein